MRLYAATLALALFAAQSNAFTSTSQLSRQQQKKDVVNKGLNTPTFVTSTAISTPLHMSILERFGEKYDATILKKANEAYLATLNTRVEKINKLETEIEDLGDDELAEKTAEFKKRIEGGEDENGKILEEAFAVVREAAWRVLEQRHYDVQLVGGMILNDGRLAEMATGEGKTLVSTLPCYLNALMGKTAFVITVNDYLAKRDAEKMGQIHRFLGLSVGLIQSNMDEEARKKAYECDIVYVTNSELGFDYLRDHLALSPKGTVLPPSAEEGEFDSFCVVDEADSVLIDEARTPLIISKQVPAVANRYETANTLADALQKNVHYTVDEKNKNIVLNENGYEDSERALGVETLFEVGPGGSWIQYISNAIKGKELFEKDIDYAIVKDDSGVDVGIGIIDSFTGRVLEGRRWSDGLHQSIEAKEKIAVSQQSQVIAKVTYQSLFRNFSRLSGMTGTAMSDAAEFYTTYGLEVTPVPTALPIARRDYPDVAFKTRKAADEALIREVVNVGGGESDGRPCLIGTTSVQNSEQLVEALTEAGIEAELLNAMPKNAERESEIVAQAGRPGVVTVATNMAGRGTDILLGGCPSTMARLQVRSTLVEKGTLSTSEMEKLPPSPDDSYYPCKLNEDVQFMLADATAAMKKKFGDDLTALQLDEILTVATDTTEAEDDPDHIVKLRDTTEAVKELYKPILAEEKEAVQKAGGLYVMGTCRHESSRIDGQLRGRSGRQGDPGTSRFFLSFEDDMFVLFGGDGLQNILKTFRVSDDMPVEAPQVTDALDRVQNIVEEKYQEIREQILNFDEVLNGQRKVIYARRQNVLFSSLERSMEIFKTYNKETVKDIVLAQATEDGAGVNVDKLMPKVSQFFPPAGALLTPADFDGLDANGAVMLVTAAVDEIFDAKIDEFEDKAKAKGQTPQSLARSANYITLVTMDNAWSDHLQQMEDLKESAALRKFQGTDIVQEYQEDALALFEGLEDRIRLNTVYSLWQSFVAAPQTVEA